MITLSGMQPYEDINIQFTGLRPGEKMYEELFNTSESFIPTSHPRIRAAQCQMVERAFMKEQIEIMKTNIMCKDVERLLNQFVDLVPGYQCHMLQNKTCKENIENDRAVAVGQ